MFYTLTLTSDILGDKSRRKHCILPQGWCGTIQTLLLGTASQSITNLKSDSGAWVDQEKVHHPYPSFFPCQNFWKNWAMWGFYHLWIRFKSIPFKCKTMAHLHWCLGSAVILGLDVPWTKLRVKHSAVHSHKGTVSHLWRKDLFFLSGLWVFGHVMYLHLKHNSGF